MHIKCVAIDDEPFALEIIRSYLRKYPSLELTATFEDAVSGSEFLKSTQIDVLFLDISMPDITGLDLARSLQHKPLIVFTTAYKNFAFEGFEVEAFDYLLKPIDPQRFFRTVTRITEYYALRSNDGEKDQESIFVYSEYRMVKILLSEIEYIETMDDYLKIHLPHSKHILTIMTVKAILEKLPASKFRRIHRSFIVPVSKVIAVQNKRVQLSSGVELPVSSSYADFIKDWSGK
jgi:two-component system, LytTR family, response regulator